MDTEYPDVSDLPVEDAKQILRSLCRGRRSELPEGKRLLTAQRLADLGMDFCRGADTAAVYVNVNAEPPTDLLIDRLAEAKIRVLVPKLGPGLTREWAEYVSRADLSDQAPGRPPSPSGPAMDSRVLRDVDVVLVPALLVNTRGERIGQGGGWYDRVLKEVGGDTRVAAVVYSEEFVDFPLPQEEMDVRVPWALMPDGVRHMNATE